MKKVIFILSIIASFLFIINFKSDALINNDKLDVVEGFHSIEFENLNSKNINTLFKDLNGTVIEVEVETKQFTKSYKFNTRLTNNIEEIIMNKVVKDLIDMNERESAVYYQTKGFKINKIDLICTNEIYKEIKDREYKILH